MFSKKQYRLVDDSFWDVAPVLLSGQASLPVSSQVAFAHLADTNSWSTWYPTLNRAEWTSPAPFGEGSTRVIQLRGKAQAEQQVTAWEEGFRIVFCFTSGREPGMAAGAEEFWLRPTSPTSCELSWRMAVDVAGFAKIIPKISGFILKVHPASNALQRQVPRAFAKHLAKLARPAGS